MPVLDYHRKSCTVFVPDLQWFAADAVQDRKEAWLVGVLEHNETSINAISILYIIILQSFFYRLIEIIVCTNVHSLILYSKIYLLVRL